MSSFAAFNIYNAYQGAYPKRLETKDKIALGVDTLLVVVFTILCVLAATHILPILQGVSQNALIYGLATTAIIVFSSVLVAAMARCLRRSPRNNVPSSSDTVSTEMRQAQSLPPPSRQAKNESMQVAANEMIENLYLGNRSAFEESYCSKSSQYGVIITVCPLGDIEGFCRSLCEVDNKTISQNLRKKGTEWIYVGGFVSPSITFSQNGWHNLAYRCTFFNEEEPVVYPRYSKNYETVGELTVEALTQEDERRKAAIQKRSVTEWFEPIFLKIDDALRAKRKVLIHSNFGNSRSAALMAAYMIKRYRFTADQAVNFLRSKRPCVDPIFMEQLQAYQVALKVV